MQLTAFSPALMFNPSLQPAKPSTRAEIPAPPMADTFQRQNGLIAPRPAMSSGSVGSTFAEAEQQLRTGLTRGYTVSFLR